MGLPGGIRDLFSLSVDQDDVSDVDQASCGLADDKDRVPALYGVDQQDQSPDDAEEPERDRDHTLLLSFGGDPLDEKAHKKQGLTHKAEGDPKTHNDSLFINEWFCISF